MTIMILPLLSLLIPLMLICFSLVEGSRNLALAVSLAQKRDDFGCTGSELALSDSTFKTAVDNWIDGSDIETNGHISCFNTAGVTSFSYAFDQKGNFNEQLLWDTSSATTMSYMFNFATSFDQSLDHFVTSSVTDMGFAFYFATSFDQSLDSWDLSSVTVISFMFSGATSFSQTLCWDLSEDVNTFDMFKDSGGSNSYGTGVCSLPQARNDIGCTGSELALTDETFQTAIDLWFSNEDLAHATYGHISCYSTAAVTNMASAFNGKNTFNEQLLWDTTSVTNMRAMFHEADSFNQSLDHFDISLVDNMEYMFARTYSFFQTLCWDLNESVNTYEMFKESGGGSIGDGTGVCSPNAAFCQNPSDYVGLTSLGFTTCDNFLKDNANFDNFCEKNGRGDGYAFSVLEDFKFAPCCGGDLGKTLCGANYNIESINPCKDPDKFDKNLNVFSFFEPGSDDPENPYPFEMTGQSCAIAPYALAFALENVLCNLVPNSDGIFVDTGFAGGSAHANDACCGGSGNAVTDCEATFWEHMGCDDCVPTTETIESRKLRGVSNHSGRRLFYDGGGPTDPTGPACPKCDYLKTFLKLKEGI